jgi:hypothetical protein
VNSYWSGWRIGLLLADVFAAGVVMLVIGLVGYLCGTFVAVIVLSGILAVAFMRQARTMAHGGPASSLLRAERIVITDQRGIVRAALDSTGLRLADNAGSPRIVIAVDSDGPAFQVWDEQGRVQLNLGSGANGITGLTLVDEAGKTRGQAVIHNGMQGLVSFAVNDQNGQLRGDFSLVGAFGGARLNLSDENGKSIWTTP